MLSVDVLEAIISRLVERFDPEKIILFGSHASGNADALSDVDLLIIAETDLPPSERYPAARRALAGIPLAFDVFLKTPEEYQRRRDVVNHLVHLADKYGKVIYERPPP